MPKPQWLIDKQMNAQRITKDPDLCVDCIYYGPLVRYTKHKGKEKVGVHSCDIHLLCENTKYSICCEDFVSGQLV